MKKRSFLIFGFLFFLPFFSNAYANTLYLKIDSSYQTWEVDPVEFSSISSFQKSTLKDYDILPLSEQKAFLEPYLENQELEGFDQVKIQQYLQEKIAPDVNRPRSDVTISRNAESGEIEFEGYGLEGWQLDVKKGAQMISQALEEGINYVHLPVVKEQPVVTVLDEELKEKGIKELIGAGQTDASGSSYSRYINVDIGIGTFDGLLLPPGEVSFSDEIGPITAAEGYVQEMVIKGPKVVPEYGGGMCQVSSTLFRAVLDAGLPVTDRTPHSFIVSYYKPYGLDATVYTPIVDLKFMNDTGQHILIQTLRLDGDVHYNIYGTSDGRMSHVIGPHYKGWTGIPAARVEYTDTLPPGAVQVVGNPVPGLHVTWHREVEFPDDSEKDFVETYDSRYQARPSYRIIGGAAPSAEPTTEGGGETATNAE